MSDIEINRAFDEFITSEKNGDYDVLFTDNTPKKIFQKACRILMTNHGFWISVIIIGEYEHGN